jgi:ribosomal protein L19
VDRLHRSEHGVGRRPEAALRDHRAERVPEEGDEQQVGRDPERAQVFHGYLLAAQHRGVKLQFEEMPKPAGVSLARENVRFY